MAQARHLTPVGQIVKIEDAIDRKIFSAAFKITTPIATIASIGVLLLFIIIAAVSLWTLFFLITSILKL